MLLYIRDRNCIISSNIPLRRKSLADASTLSIVRLLAIVIYRTGACRAEMKLKEMDENKDRFGWTNYLRMK